MIKATKIRMKMNCYNSSKVEEIKDIYLEGSVKVSQWYTKESIHDFIKNEDGKVYVNTNPFPKLIAVTTATDRYVRSTANDYEHDNLLELPRER